MMGSGARWSDRIQLGPNSGVFQVAITLAVNGSLDRGYVNGSGPLITAGGVAAEHSFVGLPEFYSFQSVPFETVQRDFNTRRTFYFAPDQWNQVQFWYDIQTTAYVQSSPATFAGPISASSDFGNSAGITGIRFLNSAGGTMTNVNYSFLNGTTFYDPDAPISTVPEPATWTLMATGLLVLCGASRFRRSA